MSYKNKISKLRILTQLAYLTLFIASVLSKNIIFMMAMSLAIILGPIFCGWLCFFGFYQDLLRHIGKKIKKKPFEIDESIHKYLKYSRYIVLIAAITIGGVFLFPDEMKHTLASTINGHPQINTAMYAVFVLGILSLFTKRFYCRYCCIFGAKQGLLSLIRPITIKRNIDKCTNCLKCNTECTMNIDVHKSNNLSDPNCINCFKCIEKCPRECLHLGFRNYLKP